MGWEWSQSRGCVGVWGWMLPAGQHPRPCCVGALGGGWRQAVHQEGETPALGNPGRRACGGWAGTALAQAEGCDTDPPHHLVTRGASLQGCLDYSPIEWWRFTCRIGNSVLRIKVRHQGRFSTGTPGSRPVLMPTSPFHSVYPVWMTDELNVPPFMP